MRGPRPARLLALALLIPATAGAQGLDPAALKALRGPIDAFFDKVLVNADDAAIRANRLALLARIRQATTRVADFSRIAG